MTTEKAQAFRLVHGAFVQLLSLDFLAQYVISKYVCAVTDD
ncbi:hypothetical protein ACFL3Q_08865 [Planctomycetota bacterium]